MLNDSTTYFPFSFYAFTTSQGKAVFDSFSLKAHSLILWDYKEPKLFTKTGSHAVYRLTTDGPFSYSSVVTVEELDSGRCTLTLKVGNGNHFDISYYDTRVLTRKERKRFNEFLSGKVDSASISDLFEKGVYVRNSGTFRFREQKIQLTSDEFTSLVHLFQDNGFWNYPKFYGHGADGFDVILEGYNATQGYYMVYRWSPQEKYDASLVYMTKYMKQLSTKLEKDASNHGNHRKRKVKD